MAREAKKRAAKRPDEKRTRDWLVFEWWVPSDGFEWVDGKRVVGDGDDAGPWLVARGVFGERYRPLHDPSRGPRLFQELADVTDRDTARLFANRYGALGVPVGIVRAGSTTGLHGESLSRWVREAAHLRAAVQVADAARAKDRARLEKWIQVRKGRGAVFSHPDLDGELPDARESDDAFQVLGPKLPGLGLLFAQRLINSKLEKDTMPRVLADAPGELVLGITPRHLLAAAWLQLAKWLTGESTTQFKRCLGCNKWLAIGPRVGRVDRTFCDDTCYRRVKRARERAGRK